MNAQSIAARFLRAAGMSLIVLGLVHIAATPHIPSLLNGSPPAVYERAVGPILLNHVLVGILLLPLGYTTWLTTATHARDETWATHTLIANTVVALTLPIGIAVFMRRSEYYGGPLFVTGVGLVAIISLLMVSAMCIRIGGRRWSDRESTGALR
jgi:hypothetical protein